MLLDGKTFRHTLITVFDIRVTSENTIRFNTFINALQHKVLVIRSVLGPIFSCVGVWEPIRYVDVVFGVWHV